MNNFSFLKNKSGVTLIALVIIIIVMLILAGVSISFVIGDNNTVEIAAETATKMTMSEVSDQVNVALINCMTEYYTATYMADSSLGFCNWLTTSRFNKELTDANFMLCSGANDKTELFSSTELVLDNEYIYVASRDESSDIYEIKLDVNSDLEFEIASIDLAGQNVQIADANETTDEEITEEESKNTTAEDIYDSDNKIKFYGATVNNYECEYNDAVDYWKIFYADEEHVYLIASNYIAYNFCPNGREGSEIVKNKTTYKVSFENVINDYTGSNDITEEIRPLNSLFFNGGYSSETLSMKAVSYILDTDVWSVYKGENADYAIGSPTIELLFDSYNDKYKTNYKYKVVDNDGTIGYLVSTFGVTYEDYLYEILDPSDELYVINNTDYAEALWLASPSAKDGSSLMRASYWGSIGDGAYNYCYPGLRPVVCLSSDVELIPEVDGTYTIK